MTYYQAMARVLQLDESVYRDIASRESAPKYGFTNVISAGVLYGLFSIYFHRSLFEVFTHRAEIIITQVLLVVSGIFVALLLHFSSSLLFWAFSRGLGSKTGFKDIYYNLGIAVIPLWLSMPGLVAINSGMTGFGIYLLTLLPFLYTVSTVFQAVKSASGLSNFRTLVATAITFIYIVSFLYLWI